MREGDKVAFKEVEDHFEYEEYRVLAVGRTTAYIQSIEHDWDELTVPKEDLVIIDERD